MVADGLRRADFLAGERFDGKGSFAILDYLPFDNLGTAPEVSLLEPEDRDPSRPGIQIEAGQEVRLEARSRDDVQVRIVRLFVDGEETGQDVRFPWQLPFRRLQTGTVSVQVEAEDTGGNVGLSEALTIEVISDTTPPQLIGRAPADAPREARTFVPPVFPSMNRSMPRNSVRR